MRSPLSLALDSQNASLARASEGNRGLIKAKEKTNNLQSRLARVRRYNNTVGRQKVKIESIDRQA